MKGSARFTIAIGRALGAIVVTVHGELDLPSAAHLESVLTDLIDSQDKVTLIVDLHDARDGDEDALLVLASAAELAETRGGTLILSCPSDAINAALEAAGLAEMVSADGAHRSLPAATGQPSRRWDHPAGGAQERSLPDRGAREAGGWSPRRRP